MNQTRIAPGHAYRLLINFEVHDENTGTMREFLLKGTVIKVKRVAADQGRVWVEGHDYPFPLWAFEKQVIATD